MKVVDGKTRLGYAAGMKHHKVLFLVVLVAALSGCSGMRIGIGLPIGGFGGFGGVGVSVGSDGRVGGNVTVGSGGVVVGAGGTAQLPPKSPDPIASAPG